MDILTMLAFYHILPAIVGSAFTLFIVLIFMKIFFIRRPSLRHMFLFAPLIKPFTILIGGFYVPMMERIKWRTPYVHPGIQMPDPLNMVEVSYEKYGSFRLADGTQLAPETTALFAKVMLISGIAFFIMLSLRWVALYVYRLRIAASQEIDLMQHKHVYEMAYRLHHIFKVKMPKIAFAAIPCPLMIGFKNCSIILPADSIAELSESELEATLAHEFAHIKRRDNVKLWFAIALRDLLFFSPFAWLTFRLMAVERERAADYLAAQVTGKPVELAGAIAKVAEIMSGFGALSPTLGIVKSDLAPRLSMTRRVNDLLNFKPRKRLILRVLPLTLLFLLLFYVRFSVHIKLPGNQIFGFFG